MVFISAPILFLLLSASLTIFDFTPESSLDRWYVVDDVVMGGRSAGRFILNQDGHGVFTGNVSLQNNGGFSSVRYTFEPLNVREYSRSVIRVRGDGKRYQFRVRSTQFDRASYVTSFQTNGNWQVIEIPFSGMYPTYRGYRLEQANYNGDVMREIAFLIGNKKPETFRLEIDYIRLEE